MGTVDQSRKWWVLLVVLISMATGSRSGQAAANLKMAEARRLNRAFQVELGRSMAPKEAKTLLSQSSDGAYGYMRGSGELKAVYVERLSRFVKGRMRNSTPTRQMQARMSTLAEPDKPLGLVLTKVAEGHHGGRLCYVMEGSVCFARWLARSIAPGYGIEWVRARQNEIPQMTYAQLVEGLAREGASL